MKYFTYSLVATANDWIEQTEAESQRAEQQFWATVEDYHQHLDSLKSRVSRPAWNFFRHGFGHYGLHDATLLSLSVGDGLDYAHGENLPLSLNRRRTSTRIEFLNFEQDFHYLFDLCNVSQFQSNLFFEKDSGANSLDDLFTYELTEVNKDHLQLGFLFVSGATIIVQFRKLVFRRRRIEHKNEIGDIQAKPKRAQIKN